MAAIDLIVQVGLTTKEIWLAIHYSYGDELGLNADEDKDYVACTEHERATFCDVVQSYSKVLSGSEMFFPVNRTDHNSMSAPEQASTCS